MPVAWSLRGRGPTVEEHTLARAKPLFPKHRKIHPSAWPGLPLYSFKRQMLGKQGRLFCPSVGNPVRHLQKSQ